MQFAWSELYVKHTDSQNPRKKSQEIREEKEKENMCERVEIKRIIEEGDEGEQFSKG